MKVEQQITIKGSKEKVWEVITNIREVANTISSIEKIEILNEPEKELVGLKWSETRLYFGKPSAIDKYITSAVDNTYYTTKAQMDEFTFLTTFAISESGENTLLTSTHETNANGFIAKLKSLPMIFFKGMLRKAILKDLVDIKTKVEHN